MGVVTAVLLAAGVFIYSTSSNSNITFFAISENGICEDMTCIQENFISCTPAKMQWTSESGEESVTAVVEVVGVVDTFCNFKMISDGRLLRECYFPLDSLNEQLIEEFLKGKDNGFSQLISDSCI